MTRPPVHGEQLSDAQILDELVAIEARYDVDQWSVDGLDVWPLVRISVAFDLYRDTRGPPPSWSARNVVRAVVRYGRGILDAHRRDRENSVPFDSEAQVLMLQGEYNRRDTVAGRRFDVVQDSVAENLAARGVGVFSWERSMASPPSAPRGRATRFLGPEWPVLARMALPNGRVGAPALSRALVTQCGEAFRRLPLVPSSSISEIVAFATCVLRLKREFHRRMRGARARFCLVEDWIQPDSFALSGACRDLGIVPVDVQHGLQGRNHPSYGRWTRLPRRTAA